ncbi:MAG: UDP-N-acetylmuramoyl-L-alanine--D-glutamate ligase [Clostridiales bacterium]|nr:UDP-N-acetylmuramoyl-L-alanine--D-glutamate ligase [Clostridiales bacterium]
MGIFDGKRFFVYGNGGSGKAAACAIKKLGGKAKIYADDGGRFVAPPDKDYDCAVISPGVRPTHAVYDYCAERGIKAVGEAEIGFAIAKSYNRKTVGITGTNGKTTTTKLIADMLAGVACGNIGYPVSTAACEKSTAPIVCELSSFQLFNANISPDVAVITNMASDHADWHGGIENYHAAKCNIAANMDSNGYLVLGEDIPVRALNTLHTNAQIVWCSSTALTDGAYVLDGYFQFNGNRVCPTDYLRLSGAHNVKNALCAIAAAMCMGADNSAILGALSGAKNSPHRNEVAGRACGKLWIDDSKGTNVSACLAAIELTVGTVCLILGGRGKDTDFDELFSVLGSRVTSVVAMGETAQAVRDSACKIRPDLKVTVVNCLSDAVRVAAESDAETVLLSPACASFDEFKSYAHRGEFFKAEVCALSKRMQ